MMNIRIAALLVVFAGIPTLALPSSANSAAFRATGKSADRTGSLTGKVVDATTGEPINAASVTVNGTALRESTDGDGLFLIEKAPAGGVTLSVMRPGYKKRELSVSIVAGQTTMWTIALWRVKQ